MNHLPISLFEENEKAIEALFLLLGITRVEVTFSGSGDSGSIEDVVFSRNEQAFNPPDAARMTYWKSVGAEFDGNRWVSRPPKKVEGSLVEAVQQIANDHIEGCGVDWYNNDGGFGEWSWEPDTGIRFEVHQYETTSNLVDSYQSRGVFE